MLDAVRTMRAVVAAIEKRDPDLARQRAGQQVASCSISPRAAARSDECAPCATARRSGRRGRRWRACGSPRRSDACTPCPTGSPTA
jgi:hypothetical protein